MKFKKKDLLEIIDANGELIGQNDVPSSGADLDSAANNTTDYNTKIGQQPMRWNTMSLMGFNMMPFYEGKEDEADTGLFDDLAKLMYDKYMETLEYYYRNPNKLKSDFRMMSEKDFNSQPEERRKIDDEWVMKIINTIKPHVEKSFGKSESLDESAVLEDKMVDKKSEDEISTKSEDKDVQEKKIEKIAGLINKLEKGDINKLINLLERK